MPIIYIKSHIGTIAFIWNRYNKLLFSTCIMCTSKHFFIQLLPSLNVSFNFHYIVSISKQQTATTLQATLPTTKTQTTISSTTSITPTFPQGSTNLQNTNAGIYVSKCISDVNPQMPKVFRQPKTPKGGGWYNPPLDFCLLVQIFWKYFSWVCFRGQGRNPMVII